ncbi:helix-turn-helix transcriptional regulator [Vibrio sp. YMD68]|uniref:helix-turn-helix transcriptional regulator n=1 Tax=Vibrio sp. YMD68 TaxID=3042300 RepID=UPI00249C9063|nr:helix-turn-helix transcriptional regulator [Vibrio sp. YMD68]WGV98587.1 helix-turn-helix transcriptional regulator [Vibrio sp. YMD68]
MNSHNDPQYGYYPIVVSPIELESILLKELDHLGIEHVVLMVFDPWFYPKINVTHGFNAKQMVTYQTHQSHDAFLTHYLNKKLTGQLVYMQEMLPLRKISDETFLDILVPTMQMHHSYGGLHRILNHHHLMLSCHSFQKLNMQQQRSLTELWHFLVHWANGWVSNQLIAKQWEKLNAHTQQIESKSNLTHAETQILALLIQGLDGSEIASSRRVSKETVRTQIKQVLHKTGCKHQNQLISRYFHNHLFL